MHSTSPTTNQLHMSVQSTTVYACDSYSHQCAKISISTSAIKAISEGGAENHYVLTQMPLAPLLTKYLIASKLLKMKKKIAYRLKNYVAE